MELTFSTASTELYRMGKIDLNSWKAAYPEDETLRGLDHPVVAINGDGSSVGLFEVSVDYFSSIMWIDSLWVDPKRRGEGHGSAILDYLVKTCEYSKVKLFAVNNSSQFYLKNGFFNSVGNYYERIIHV